MMRTISLLLSTLLVLIVAPLTAQVVTDKEGRIGIGTLSPDKSAILTLESTTGGLLLPRLSETQRDALVEPPTGLMIYNTTKGELDYNFGTKEEPKWGELVTSDKLGKQVGETAWLLEGNAGTEPGVNFLGTTDDVPLEIHVGHSRHLSDPTLGAGRVMRYEPNDESPNIIGGFYGNSVAAGTVGAVIGGGGRTYGYVGTIGTNVGPNRLDGDYGAIGGGASNLVASEGKYSTISGGVLNRAEGNYSAISGGMLNRVDGQGSIVAGGEGNTVDGPVSTIVGGRDNVVDGLASVAVGGINNEVRGNYSGILGGINNHLFPGTQWSFIAGGDFNEIHDSVEFGAILGGDRNDIRRYSENSLISGGSQNTIGQGVRGSVIVGGAGLTLNGSRSFGFLANSEIQLQGWPSVYEDNLVVNDSNLVVFGNTDLWLANNNGEASAVRLYEAQSTSGNFPAAGTNYSAFRAGSQIADITYILPDSAGSPGDHLEVLSVSGTEVQLDWGLGTAAPDGGWLLAGNTGTSAGTDFLGTTDDQAFEIHVADDLSSGTDGRGRVVRYSPGSASPTIVAGYQGNIVEADNGAAVLSGGLAGGEQRILEGSDYSVIGGGEGNFIDGDHAGILSGLDNTIIGNQTPFGRVGGDKSVIAGGADNRVDGSNYVVVAGGESNRIEDDGSHSSIGGGRSNSVDGAASVIGGGESNSIDDDGSHAAIGGGESNRISGKWSGIGSGVENEIEESAVAARVGGGEDNIVEAKARHSVISGGSSNRVEESGSGGVIGGGAGNTIEATEGFVQVNGGNELRTIDSSLYSVIAGGRQNRVRGSYSGVLSGARNRITGELNTPVLVGGQYSVVSGGADNSVESSDHVVVAGGEQNSVKDDGSHSSIGGGKENSIDERSAVIGGGEGNQIVDGAEHGVISGGSANRTAGEASGIGSGSENTIEEGAFAARVGGGEDNVIEAKSRHSVISGGSSNRVEESGSGSVIGGGWRNTIEATEGVVQVNGGSEIRTIDSSLYSTIAGGVENRVRGSYSAIPGGHGLTLNVDGSFGFLGNNFGTNNMSVSTPNTALFGNTDLWLANNDGEASALRLYEAQSTAGDFPAVGTNYSGLRAGNQTADIIYVLPDSAGSPGDQLEVLSVSGAEVRLDWSAPTTIDAWLLSGNSGTSAGNDFLGTTDDQAFEIHVADDLSSGTDGRGRVAHFAPGVESPSIAMGYQGNVIAAGDGASILSGGSAGSENMVQSGANYSVIGGGRGNRTSGSHAAVVGGSRNSADASISFIGGGEKNSATGLSSAVVAGRENAVDQEASFVGAGRFNTATGNDAAIVGGAYNEVSSSSGFIGGGFSNTVSGEHAVVAGGLENSAEGEKSFVGGGKENQAVGSHSVVVGGSENSSEASISLVGGGQRNSATGIASGVVAGIDNSAENDESFVGSGRSNRVSGYAGVVVGGTTNRASGAKAIVGGGSLNVASGGHAAVGGGDRNSAGGDNSFVGGGRLNGASGEGSGILAGSSNGVVGEFSSAVGGAHNSVVESHAFIGGGESNELLGRYGVIVGGRENQTSFARFPFIGGGESNKVDQDYGMIGGGLANHVEGSLATIAGGNENAAEGAASFIGGGWSNTASAEGAVVSGGEQNSADGKHAIVGGGDRNSAGGDNSFVGGGRLNGASGEGSGILAGSSNGVVGEFSSAVGGAHNSVVESHAFIGGGESNELLGRYGVIVGGRENQTSFARFPFIGGGESNKVDQDYGMIGGGLANHVEGSLATIAGGNENAAEGAASFIGGGWNNTASANASVVSGGEQNQAGSPYSTIPGGRGLTLSGSSSFGYLGGNSDGSREMTIADSNTALFGNTDLWLANNDGEASALRLYEAQSTAGDFPAVGTNYSGLRAGNQTADIIYVLPDSAGGPGDQLEVLSVSGAEVRLDWSAPATMDAWLLEGNTATNPATDYVGTSDATRLRLAVNAGSDNSLILNTNGSIQRDQGGDPRGEDVVDLQRVRSDPGQVAVGDYSTIGGGQSNQARNPLTTVGGGRLNVAFNPGATVSGGDQNSANGPLSVVGGGEKNRADGEGAFIGGGASNSTADDHAVVSGGRLNVASGFRSVVGGGFDNEASGAHSTVAGGSSGEATGEYATTSGGSGNSAVGYAATVSGGSSNKAEGNSASVGGGSANQARATHSAIAGGFGMILDTNATGSFAFNSSYGNAFGPNMVVDEPGIALFGNADILLANNTGDASVLRFYESEPATGAFPTDSTNYTGIVARRQRTDIVWHLPDSAGAAGDFLRVTSVSGSDITLDWDTLEVVISSGNVSWDLVGNSGTTAGVNFLGTTDDEPFEVHVDNAGYVADNSSGRGRVARFEPNSISPNVILGYHGNEVVDGQVASVVGGGGFDGFENRIDASGATIGGGLGNLVEGGSGVIAGGTENIVSGANSAIGGGTGNVISGKESTVAGGVNNRVTGAESAIPGGSDLTLGSASFGFNAGGASGTDLSGEVALAYFGNVDLWLGNTTGSASALRFYEANSDTNYDDGAGGPHYSAFRAGDQPSSISYRLPLVLGAPGEQYVLTDRDGTGTLEWWSIDDLVTPPEGWNLQGNSGTTPGTEFLGTRDDVAFQIHVGDSVSVGNDGRGRALRIEPNATSPNVVVGYKGNEVSTGVVGAVIGGGGRDASENRITIGANYGVVAGGRGNLVEGEASAIGGGHGNLASGKYSVVAGGGEETALAALEDEKGVTAAFLGLDGEGNRAEGDYSVVSGGRRNIATGDYSAIPGGRNLTVGTNSFGYSAGTTQQTDLTPHSNVSYFGNTDLWIGNVDGSARALRFYEGNTDLDYVNPNPLIANYSAFTAQDQRYDISYLLPAVEGLPGYALTVASVTLGPGDPATADREIALQWTNATANAWQLDGNSGTTAGDDFIGTTDNEPFEIHVYRDAYDVSPAGGVGRVMRFEPGHASPNIIGGHNSNSVRAGTIGATISGGGGPGSANVVDSVGGTIGGGFDNVVQGQIATVGGGINNRVSGRVSTVAGGESNVASGSGSTVGGGVSNESSGRLSVIPGGQNLTVGSYSFGFNGDDDLTRSTNVSGSQEIAYFGNVDLWLGNVDTAARELRFYAPNADPTLATGFYSAFKAGAQKVPSITYTLPVTPPSYPGGVLRAGTAGPSPSLEWGSPDTYHHTNQTANYTMTEANSIVGVSQSTAAITVTLPATANLEVGKTVIIKDEAGNAGTLTITIVPDNAATEKIDGALNASITSNYEVLRLYYGGGGKWFTY